MIWTTWREEKRQRPTMAMSKLYQQLPSGGRVASTQKPFVIWAQGCMRGQTVVPVHTIARLTAGLKTLAYVVLGKRQVCNAKDIQLPVYWQDISVPKKKRKYHWRGHAVDWRTSGIVYHDFERVQNSQRRAWIDLQPGFCCFNSSLERITCTLSGSDHLLQGKQLCEFLSRQLIVWRVPT